MPGHQILSPQWYFEAKCQFLKTQETHTVGFRRPGNKINNQCFFFFFFYILNWSFEGQRMGVQLLQPNTASTGFWFVFFIFIPPPARQIWRLYLQHFQG